MAGNDIDDVRQLLNLGSSDENLDTAIKAFQSLHDASSRRSVAKIVVWLYAAVLSAVILFLIYKGIVDSAAAFGHMIEIVKIALVPIVTLVIGYYFGSSSGK